MSVPDAPARYFVTTKDGRRLDTGCTILVLDRQVASFHNPQGDAKTGALMAFAPGFWREIEWASK